MQSTLVNVSDITKFLNDNDGPKIFVTASNLYWKNVLQIRILYAVWMMSVVILSNSYGSCFYSILAVPEFERPIDRIEDILKIAQTDRGFLVTIRHSSYLDTFLSSQPDMGIYYLIGRHMARYP